MSGTRPAGQSTDRPGRPAGAYLAGARVGAGLAVGSFLLAVTFGALARQDGWGTSAPIVASLAVFSGSAQFALVTALASGGAAWAAVASAALINLRFLPMAIAVTPALRGGRLRRALEGQAVVDGSWVAAHQEADRFDRATLIGATLVQWPAWVAGTVLGVVVAPPADLVHTLGLDAVFPAFFTVLLVDELRTSRRAVAAGLGGALLTAVLLLVTPAGLALLGGSAAALIGLRAGRLWTAASAEPSEPSEPSKASEPPEPSKASDPPEPSKASEPSEAIEAATPLVSGADRPPTC